MGTLHHLDDYRFPWHEVLTVDGQASTLQVFRNDMTGEIEIAQMNDEGEAVRTTLSRLDVDSLKRVLDVPKKAVKGR